MIAKEDYQQAAVSDLLGTYFDSSTMKLANYFARKRELDPEQLVALIDRIKNQPE